MNIAETDKYEIGAFKLATDIQTIDVEHADRYTNDTGRRLRIYHPESSWCNETGVDNILDVINSSIKPIVEQFAYCECVLGRAWVNIHCDPGDCAFRHNHDEADYTSLYYVNTPKDCGNLYAEIDDNTYEFIPGVGDLIIMKGWVEHWTDINKSNEARVSIVCDWLVDTDK